MADDSAVCSDVPRHPSCEDKVGMECHQMSKEDQATILGQPVVHLLQRLQFDPCMTLRCRDQSPAIGSLS